MSPELIEPQDFDLDNSCRTKKSDCYALWMVIYEIISGHLPFHEHADYAVVSKVLKGKRPHLGAEFPGILSEMLRLCWMPHPSDRPNIEDVLHCLESVLELSKLPPPSVDETTTTGDDDWNLTTESSGKISYLIPSARLHCLCSLREYRDISVR